VAKIGKLIEVKDARKVKTKKKKKKKGRRQG
jgi:hypothetical protein